MGQFFNIIFNTEILAICREIFKCKNLFEYRGRLFPLCYDLDVKRYIIYMN